MNIDINQGYCYPHFIIISPLKQHQYDIAYNICSFNFYPFTVTLGSGRRSIKQSVLRPQPPEKDFKIF